MELSKEAKVLVEDLKCQGFDIVQIKDAMCDGEFIKEAGIDQEIAEEIYNEA